MSSSIRYTKDCFRANKDIKGRRTEVSSEYLAIFGNIGDYCIEATSVKTMIYIFSMTQV